MLLHYYIYICILLIFIIVFYNRSIEYFNNKSDPCDNNLTDKEYLFHMIPHHQVAVDISKILQK